MRFLKTIATNVLTACNRQKSLDLSESKDTELHRCLSTLDLTFIGIGSTLGSGIYVLTGDVARNKAGPAIVISFLFAAVASILSGLCYAEFGARIPKAGSAYIYCYLTIGEFCAFVIGWNIIMEYVIGASAIARALSAYVDSLAGGVIRNHTLAITGEIHVTGISHYIDFFALGAVLIFTAILSLGVKNSARFNNMCVTINICTVILVTIVAFVYAEPKNWSDFAPFGFEGIISGASTCFFAFIGFDVIATTCEEAKNPAKSIPISMIGTISVCFLAYCGVSASITLMVPYYELDLSSAVATAFHQRNLKFMGYIVGSGATMGLLGCTLISMVPLPRLLYAMSQDGMVMQFFSKVNHKTKVPVISTVISGLFIGILAAVLDLDSLVEMLSIGTLLAYSIVDICVIILRYRNPSDSVIKSMREITIQTEDIDNPHINPPSEETLLLEERSQENDCLRNGCNFQNNPFLINIVVVGIVFILLGISVLLSKYSHKLLERDFAFILMLLCLLLMLFGCCFYLSKLHNYVDGLGFTVPLVPWLPVLALFFNIFLMLGLSRLTWLRFFAWMVIGMIVYFGYSMHHSAERKTTCENEGGYILLELKKSDDKNTLGETSPLIKSPTKLD